MVWQLPKLQKNCASLQKSARRGIILQAELQT